MKVASFKFLWHLFKPFQSIGSKVVNQRMKKLSTSHVNAQKLKGFIPGNGPTKAQQFYEKAHNNIFMKRCVPTDERKMLQPHSCGISL